MFYRIYVDAVINHMSGKKNRGTKGTAGSKFDGVEQTYPDYTSEHFNDEKCMSFNGDVTDFEDADEVRIFNINFSLLIFRKIIFYAKI